MISHEQQQQIWDEEHAHPTVLKQMDSNEASSGIVKFFEHLQGENISHRNGLEMGCGKGRNVIWLAGKGVEMSGFDFSQSAIVEAKRRAEEAEVTDEASFIVQDATAMWPYESDTFDFTIDCFATTDIESPEGRAFAGHEFYRVLKPGGYHVAYVLSPEDEFHKELLQTSPAEEKNAFVHPRTSKFEKTFDEIEIRELYQDFEVVTIERIEKMTTFFGKEYACKHFWVIFRKAVI